MKISELGRHLAFELLTGTEDCAIHGGYTSDLLSDVMANAKAEDMLITIQAHKNAVAVASHVDAPAMMICNNRPVGEDVLEAAAEHGITICRTTHNQFTVSGILYALLR